MLQKNLSTCDFYPRKILKSTLKVCVDFLFHERKPFWTPKRKKENLVSLHILEYPNFVIVKEIRISTLQNTFYESKFYLPYNFNP